MIASEITVPGKYRRTWIDSSTGRVTSRVGLVVTQSPKSKKLCWKNNGIPYTYPLKNFSHVYDFELLEAAVK